MEQADQEEIDELFDALEEEEGTPPPEQIEPPQQRRRSTVIRPSNAAPSFQTPAKGSQAENFTSINRNWFIEEGEKCKSL